MRSSFSYEEKIGTMQKEVDEKSQAVRETFDTIESHKKLINSLKESITAYESSHRLSEEERLLERNA
jgi:peptidoglycan hydrolase CwlO-like protein